jgi:RecA/RadA recombinase
MLAIAKKHAEHARFVTIYIKEAHPTDEWQMSSNEKDGVCYAQPKTLEQRLAIARDFVERNDYAIPMVVDRLENTADALYAGWPERLYVIDAHGKIAYKGELGPSGYKPEELDEWLDTHR